MSAERFIFDNGRQRVTQTRSQMAARIAFAAAERGLKTSAPEIARIVDRMVADGVLTPIEDDHVITRPFAVIDGRRHRLIRRKGESE